MAGYPPPPGGPPVVVMAGVPGQLTMGGGAPGERTVASQEGGTQLLDAHNIQILYNAEIRDLDCCVRWAMCLGTCGNTSFNKERSYLYVRENSIESNFAMKSKFDCTSCRCDANFDATRIWYFDNEPFIHEKKCCGLCPQEPKLEVVDEGCMICCMTCCSDKKVVLMPFEKACCGCMNNRVGFCDNCGGLFGGVTGSPKSYQAIYPQPTDAEAFITACKPVQDKHLALQKLNK